MTALYVGEEIITKYLRVVPQSEPRKVVRTLLDGSDHVQIIGSEVIRLEVELAVDSAGKTVIETTDASGALFTVFADDGNAYNGRILERGSWVKMIKGMYQTTMTMSIEAVV